MLHMWWSGFVLKTGRHEVPGLIPSRACPPSHSEFSIIFSQNLRKYGLGSLRKPLPPTECIPPVGPGPTSLKILQLTHANQNNDE